LVFYGEGGFTYSDVHAMPVNVRAYYYMKMHDIIETRIKQAEEDKSKLNSSKRMRRR